MTVKVKVKVKVKVGVAIAASTLSLFALGSALWLNRPFQVELASYRTSLADRTEAQRHNIRQAARALDGVVLEPGVTFSFNQAVGPRTPERGFREASAFMERDLVTSIGGGICQVSSTLYNAALLAGLGVVERHPHSRRVASVPPGRDATVWYGMSDLKIKNEFQYPVRLALWEANESLAIAIAGLSSSDSETVVQTYPMPSIDSRALVFQTIRLTTNSGHSNVQELLSVDVYWKNNEQ